MNNSNTNPIFARNSKAFTLLSTIIVVAALLVFIGTAYGVYRSGMSARQAVQGSEQVKEIAKRITGAYATGKSFDGLTTEVAVSKNLVPESMVNSEGAVTGPWGSSVAITGTGNSYVLEYSGVSSDSCVNFVSGAEVLFDAVKVNENIVYSAGDPSASSKGNLIAQCSENDTGNVVAFINSSIFSTAPAPPSWNPCVAPDPATQFDWWPDTKACPPPKSRGLVTFEREVERTSDPACLNSGSLDYQWGPWGATGNTRNQDFSGCSCPLGKSYNPLSGACEVPCSAPAPTTNYRWVPASKACAPWESGSHTWEKEQSNTNTPYCTGTFGVVKDNWSGWSDTGGKRNKSNTCTCVPDPTQTQTRWVGDSEACPAGQSGSHTWEKKQKRTRVSSCSSGKPVYGGWSDWTDTGATRDDDNTCGTSCTPDPTLWDYKTERIYGSCPAGQSGENSWDRDYRRKNESSCASGTPQYEGWGNWVVIDWKDNPVNTCSTTCTPPAPETKYQWVGVSGSCPSPRIGTMTWEKKQERTSDPICTGSGIDYQWPSWTDTGDTRYEDYSGCSCPSGETWDGSACVVEYEQTTDGGSVTYSFPRSSRCPAPDSRGIWDDYSNAEKAAFVRAFKNACASGAIPAGSFMTIYDRCTELGYMPHGYIEIEGTITRCISCRTSGGACSFPAPHIEESHPKGAYGNTRW